MADIYDRPHLFVRQLPKSERFTSIPARAGRADLKTHDNKQHGKKLRQELDAAVDVYAHPLYTTVLIEFQSEPDLELALKNLDSPTNGIELLSVRQKGPLSLATVRVTRSGVSRLEELIDQYTWRPLEDGKPKNQALVDSIARIRRATLESIWTEVERPIPAPKSRAWFELWLIKEGFQRDSFVSKAKAFDLTVASRELVFIDRVVVLAEGQTEKLEDFVVEDTCIAEVRLAKWTAADFMDLPNQEKAAWAKDLAGRVVAAPENAPSVCILDTGVNRGHVLLAPHLKSADAQTCDLQWGAQDHNGHGTLMAGLALYGDLTPLLESKDEVRLTHQLESVKLLPPEGSNAPEIWGKLTLEAIARAEVQAPERFRVSCLAITAADEGDRGRPSSWSAALDQYSSGMDDGQRRLVCVSAGNMNDENCVHYPDANQTALVQDPAQSWNALTVGAYADRDLITEQTHEGWTAVAALGDLCPTSTTSLAWEETWPLKPDIVMAGGNFAMDAGRTQVERVNSLSLLSTFYQPLSKQFAAMGDTSAAVALASRMSATLAARYPRLWPETIRALIVHSAEWTPAMEQRFPGRKKQQSIRNKLRCFGFGVPSLDRALFSASNDATLIIEQEIQPFDCRMDEKGSSDYVTRDMHVHELPWPEQLLRELDDREVELQVTLSYFIEPSPGQRGWKYRHRYPSFGLRFDMKTSLESPPQFRARINRAAREEDEKASSSGDGENWRLGPRLRGHGSIHSDRWVGPAIALAAKNEIAVYPSIGWWKERPQLGRWDKKTRYALVISLRARGIETDIYTPLATRIGVPVEVAVPVGV